MPEYRAYVRQIYRKAAFKIVSDLGETALPEPEQPKAADKNTETVETQQPDVKPVSERLPADEAASVSANTSAAGSSAQSEASGETAVTTKPREPLSLPKGIKVEITADNLRDYVGPPIYHKDRLYTSAPPAGVSTGLGYLGNGSGAVMPIEVTVGVQHIRKDVLWLTFSLCLVRAACS